TRSPPSAQSTCSVGVPACREAGRVSCRSARTVLMTPAMPAAAWVWPRLDFREPMASGRPAGRSGPNTRARARPSLGSPSPVAGPQAGRVERGAQDAFLRRSAGGAESLAAAVLVDRRALDHGEDPVAVAPGVGEALEEDQPAALGPHHAVRVGGEGAAPPARG